MVSMVPLWEGDRDLHKPTCWCGRIWGLLVCSHTSSSNKIHYTTPMEALYKLSRIVQMVLVIILRSKWVGIMILSWSHWREWVSGEHFLNFLPLEALLPLQLFSVMAGCSLPLETLHFKACRRQWDWPPRRMQQEPSITARVPIDVHTLLCGCTSFALSQYEWC